VVPAVFALGAGTVNAGVPWAFRCIIEQTWASPANGVMVARHDFTVRRAHDPLPEAGTLRALSRARCSHLPLRRVGEDLFERSLDFLLVRCADARAHLDALELDTERNRLLHRCSLCRAGGLAMSIDDTNLILDLHALRRGDTFPVADRGSDRFDNNR